MRLAAIVILIPFFHSYTFAQSNVDSIRLSRKDSIDKIPLQIKLFSADQVELEIPSDSNETLLKKQTENVLKLNNFYSPAYSQITDGLENRNYDYGMHSVRFGNKNIYNFQFISPNKPVSEIATNRGRSFTNSQLSFQDNLDLSLVFASQYKENVIWNFNYDRQIYKGIYASGKLKNTLFNTGVNFKNKSKRLNANILYFDERHFSQDNWGITHDSLLVNSSFNIRESVPIRNSTAETNQFERSIALNLNYKWNKEYALFKPSILLQSIYSLYSFNYFDPVTDSTNTIYRSFLLDSIVSHILKQKLFSQSIQAQLIDHPKFISTVGLKYEHTSFDTDSFPSSGDLLRLDLITKLKLFSFVQIDGRFTLKYLDGHYASNLDLESSLKDIIFFETKFRLFSNAHPIPLIYKTLVLNKRPIWTNHFDPLFIRESGISAMLESKKLIKSKILVGFSRYSNYIYFDSLSYPQSIHRINKFYASIELPIKWKWIQLINRFSINNFTPNPFHINGWNSRHEFSINRSLFKKIVNANLGMRIDLFNYDYKLNYNPVIQSFYTSNETNKLITSFGIFMQFNVSDFNFTVDVDHLDSFWIMNRPSLISHYPIYDFFFKIGIQWRFLN